jgi:hypothetical protein
VVPRQAGIPEHHADLDDVEAEAIQGSLAAQGTVFPDGLHQKVDESCSTSWKLSPQDFEMQNVIGQGAFGKVWIWAPVYTRQFCHNYLMLYSLTHTPVIRYPMPPCCLPRVADNSLADPGVLSHEARYWGSLRHESHA